ncbi:hypothetical protein B0J14DRAFT_250765 [Halenospora varia]|nr:hypothetical protein B0J14DRAFT_250765 [Halenospora varia]
MVVLPDRNELWAGDGDGTIKVIDLFTHTILKNITTGSLNRADEFAYSAAAGIVVVTNPAETEPYVTILNATSHSVIGNISFAGASELEQPAYNPADGMFYVSVPDITGNPGGAVVKINVTPGSFAIQSILPARFLDKSCSLLRSPNVEHA